MTVSTTTYTQGGNSKLITIVGEIGSTTILSTINSTITGFGWTQYDVIGTTLFSPVVAYVYRVLNYDGVTYKYLIIRWDTIQLKYYVSTCESWNATTHVPTNESWSAGGAFVQGYDPQNCYFIISASARHFMIWNFINGSAGLWQAIVEFERVAPEDLASVNTSPYPCWAYTNSLMIGTPFGQPGLAYSQFCFAFPRIPTGNYTGYSAASRMVPVTNRGPFPPWQGNFGQTISGDTNYGHLGSYYKNLLYGWDTTGLKIPVSPVAVNDYAALAPFGRMFNFGVIRPIGASGDTIYANVDTTGGWLSSNATTSVNTECFVLPMNGGPEIVQFTSPTALSYTNGNLSLTTTTSPVYAGKSIAIGDNIWMATTGGIYTYSISGSLFTQRLTGATEDIVFDGVRTIYGSQATGIVKVDTLTYANLGIAASSQTLSYGCRYLGIDNKHVYSSVRSPLNAPITVVLDQATFTIGAANVMTANTSSATATNYGTPVPDYLGNVYMATQAGVATAVIVYAHKFNSNTNTITGYTSGNPYTGTSVTQHGGNAFWYDFITNRLLYVTSVPSSTAMIAVECWPGNLVQIASTSITQSGLTPATGTLNNPGTNSYFGDLSIIPFRGGLLCTPKYHNTAAATYSGLFSFISPYNGGSPYYLSTQGLATNTTGLKSYIGGTNGGLWTDGCRVLGFTNSGGLNLCIITGLYNSTTNQGFQVGRLVLRG
jgi:hypothetical protein